MAESGEDLYKKAEKKLVMTITRWKPDLEGACTYFEQAGNTFRKEGKKDRAFNSFEKLSDCMEKLGREFDAAKALETAAQLAKDAGTPAVDIADLYRRVHALYATANRPVVGAEALSRGGKLIEPIDLEVAVQLYMEACDVFEEEDKSTYSMDTFRAASAALVKAEKFEECVQVLLRHASACEKAGTKASLCRAYLAAICCYLANQDPVNAEACHNDCMQVPLFEKSEEAQVSWKLLDAYNQGDAAEIKLITSGGAFTGLENAFLKVVKKLPIGDLAKQAAALNKSRGGGGAGGWAAEAGADPDDLT